jgi:hypothetical protein
MTSAGELLCMVFGLVVVFGALWLLAQHAWCRDLSGLGTPPRPDRRAGSARAEPPERDRRRAGGHSHSAGRSRP